MWNKSKDLNVLLALDHLEPEKATKNFLNNFFKDLVPYDNIFFLFCAVSFKTQQKFDCLLWIPVEEYSQVLVLNQFQLQMEHTTS